MDAQQKNARAEHLKDSQPNEIAKKRVRIEVRISKLEEQLAALRAELEALAAK